MENGNEIWDHNDVMTVNNLKVFNKKFCLETE